MTTSPQDPIDDTDLAILNEVADLYRAVDPVPAGLVERIRFALALDALDVALMQLTEETTLATGARGERSQIFTFHGAALSMTIRVVGLTVDAVRVDGWLAPPAPHRITLRTGRQLLERAADEDGRFFFEEVPAGPVQLFVHPPGTHTPAENTLATPTVVL